MEISFKAIGTILNRGDHAEVREKGEREIYPEFADASQSHRFEWLLRREANGSIVRD